MKLNKTTVILLAAGLLTIAVQADEKERGSGKGRPEARGKGGERPDRGAAMAKALGLNEKQALQMKKLQEDQRAASGKLMAEIRKSGDREGAREKFGALREEYQKKMRAILTEEQAKKLDKMRKQFQNRRPGQRPEGEGKGKGRPGQRSGKKGSEASIEGIQYVLDDDRDRGDHRRGPGQHHDRDHGRRYDRGDDDRAKRIETMKKAWTERMKQGHHGRPDHGKNVEAAKKAWAERIKQAVEARRKAASSQVRGPKGPRPPFGGFGHGRPGPNGPQARGPRPGFDKPGPDSKGPRIRGKSSHGRPGPNGPQTRGPRPGVGKPSSGPKGPQVHGKFGHSKPGGCSSCKKGGKPGPTPKGPQARGSRPPHGKFGHGQPERRGPQGRPHGHHGWGPRR